MLKLDFLQANSGDSFLLSFTSETKNYNLLIDTGIKNTYDFLDKRISMIPSDEIIDLFVITHIDIDHIGGILRYVEKEPIKKIKNQFKEIWFNSGMNISKYFQTEEIIDREIEINIKQTEFNKELDTGYKHGISLEKYLNHNLKNNWNKNLITNQKTQEFECFKLIVISPELESLKELNENWQTEIENNTSRNTSNKRTDWDIDLESLAKNKFKEDTSLPNKSSIAFLFQIKENQELKNKILFLADAHSSTIKNSLSKLGYAKKNKLIVNIVKLSHHGSKLNLDNNLLELIDSNRFLISTNGLNGLPDKETLSRIIFNPERMKDENGKYIHQIEFIFNYPKQNYIGLFQIEDETKYNFKCMFNDENKNWISILL